METPTRAVPLTVGACALLAAVCVATMLSACGGSAAPQASVALRPQWIDNARSFISTLDSDVYMTTVGGANLATARRALGNQSDVTTMLVAYDLFADCGPSLANVGPASPQAGALVQTLISACGRLERAAALFQNAMTRHAPSSLLAASRLVLTAVPLLTQAGTELMALRVQAHHGGAGHVAAG